MRTGRDSDAIILFFKDYDLHSHGVRLYEELFNETRRGRHGRSLQCLGRLTIDLLVKQRHLVRAMSIASECLKHNEDFVLSDLITLILFTNKAIELEQYHLAYQLIRNSRKRYGQSVNIIQCQIIEAQILLRHLDQHKKVRIIISELLRLEPGYMSQDIFSLATELNRPDSFPSYNQALLKLLSRIQFP